MTKQNEQQPKQNQQQQQNTGQGNKNSDQQGGRNPQGQPGSNPSSQGQPGARQSDQGSGGRQSTGSSNEGSSKGSQRGQTANQQAGFGPDNDGDNAPQLDHAGEQAEGSTEKLDTQYGTKSSSGAGQQANRPQGSSESTGSDRDTLSGSRGKGR